MSLNAYTTGNDLIDILKIYKVNLLNLFSNKENVLDKLSVDENNNLLYDGKEISTSSGNNITFNEYDNTLTYKSNDYVIYDNCLYKCIEDINKAEEFDENKWKLLIGHKSANLTIDNLEW